MKTFLFSLLLSVALVSCSDNEKDEPEPEDGNQQIELAVTGIKVEESNIPEWDKQNYYCDIRYTGGDFTVKPIGKYASEGYVTDVDVFGNSVVYGKDYKGLPPSEEAFPEMSGDWGSFEYVSDKPPYEIKFHFGNYSFKDPRWISICFGKGAHARLLCIHRWPEGTPDQFFE